MSEKIELKSVRLVRAPENDGPKTKGYFAYAIGPNGREFRSTISVTPELEADEWAFGKIARSHLRLTYEHLVRPLQRKLSTLEWARENLDPSVGAMPTVIPVPSFDRFVDESMAAAWETLDKMPEKIEPALSAEEWAAYRRLFDAESALDVPPLHVVIEDFSAAGAIAAYNDMLPDSDPRKITREKIELLRMAGIEESEGLDDPDATAALQAFADALQSYLPPEK